VFGEIALSGDAAGSAASAPQRGGKARFCPRVGSAGTKAEGTKLALQ
jgi:hypothetical protein